MPATRRSILSISIGEQYRQPFQEALAILKKDNPFASLSAIVVDVILDLDADNAIVRLVDLRSWPSTHELTALQLVNEPIDVVAVSIPKGKLDTFYDALDGLRRRSTHRSQSALIVHGVLTAALELMHEAELRSRAGRAEHNGDVGFQLTQEMLDRFWEAWRHDNRKEIQRMRVLVKRSVLSPLGQTEEQRALQTDGLQRIAIACRDDDSWRDAWDYITEAAEIAGLLPVSKANYRAAAYYRQASIAAEGAAHAQDMNLYQPLKALALTSILRAHEIACENNLLILTEVAGRYGYLSAWANRDLAQIKHLFGEAFANLPDADYTDPTGITVSREGLLHNQARAVLCLHEHEQTEKTGMLSLEGGLKAVEVALSRLAPRWRLDATVTRISLLEAMGCRSEAVLELSRVLQQYATESARINRRLDSLKNTLNVENVNQFKIQ